MKQTYTDRDYFEEKFKNIDERFDVVDNKLDKVHKTIYGNGECGLVEKVRRQYAYIKMGFVLIATLVVVYVEQSWGAIAKLLKGLFDVL